MSIVVVHLDRREEAERIAQLLGGEAVGYEEGALERAFNEGKGIVALMACGIVVRKLAPLIKDKWTDPPVVAVSPGIKFAIPLLGGHHGANELAERLAGLGAQAVITTASEAAGLESVEVIARKRDLEVLNRESTRATNAAVLRSDIPLYTITGPAAAVVGPGVSILVRKGEYVVGLGCNKGTAAEEVVQAVRETLSSSGIGVDEVMAYATTCKKMHEPGLREAVAALNGNLVFVEDEDINRQQVKESKASLIGLKGVAEPAALFVSKRRELVRERKAYGNVTVAIAR